MVNTKANIVPSSNMLMMINHSCVQREANLGFSVSDDLFLAGDTQGCFVPR